MDETPSLGKMLGCGFLVFAAIICLSLAIWGFNVGTADIRGRANAHMTVVSGAHRLAEYDKFHALCVNVQDHEAAIDAQATLLKQTKDQASINIINQNISANQIQRSKSINDYNEATKKYNEGQFKDDNLPYQLSTTQYTPDESPHTSCASS